MVPDSDGSVSSSGSSSSTSVIVVHADRFAQCAEEITERVGSARAYVASPFFTARSDDPGLAAVTTIDGVIAVCSASEQELGMLEGIDRAISLCLGLVGEWSVGGVNPGEAYPCAFGQPCGSVAPPAVCAAVNVSLTPADDDTAPTLPSDLVNHATETLAGFAVPVVAAGNHHQPGVSYETVSPWAEPDWVLSVGATSDELGEVEWPRSARGSLNNPSVGPDLLTWGQDALSSDGFGSSFAAARISSMVALTRAWLLQLVASLDRLAGRPFGVPLVGAVVIDRLFAPQPPPPPDQDWAALPVLAVAGAALDPSTQAGHPELADLLRGPAGVTAARILVSAAAAETTPNPATPLSAPSLTPARLTGFLDGLSLSDVQSLVAGHGLAPRTGEPSLFAPATADQLKILVEATMPIWEWDIDTRMARMRHRKEET